VPSQRVEELRVRHLERYLMSRRETCSEKSARRNLQDLLLIVRALPAQDRLDGRVADYLGQRGHGVDAQQVDRPGYSDREFQAIMTAARSDVVAIRDRLAAGESLLEQFQNEPDALSAAERDQGARLEAMARTGRLQVDYQGLTVGEYPAACCLLPPGAGRQSAAVDVAVWYSHPLPLSRCSSKPGASCLRTVHFPMG
jgi:hypothetical protein